jgi:hypothetical protein
VPLAPPEIAGVLNVRGRILTIIDMRRRLELEVLEESRRTLVVGIEHKGESYGLLIDRVGEVLKLPARSDWTESSWWCSISIACSSSAPPPKQRESEPALHVGRREARVR